MTNEEFVHAIKIVVRDDTVAALLSILEHPPGRKPRPEIKEWSQWYHSLDDEQRRMLSGIIKDAVDKTVFGFLCVIDGVRAIEDVPNKGRLELRYVGDKSVMLNAPTGDMLHDLF